MRSEFDKACNVFLIAFRIGDEVPVGYAKLCTAPEDPGINGENTIEIERIMQTSELSVAEWGAAPMRACLKVAEEFECQTIWLGVWERNERAIQFYERWRFKAVGSRQFALGSKLQNDLLMARQLT